MTTADLITFFAIIQVLAAVGAMLFGVLNQAGLQRNPDLHAHSLGGRNAVIFQIDVLQLRLESRQKNFFH